MSVCVCVRVEGMVVLFEGYGTSIWGVVLLFVGMFGIFVWRVQQFYLGGMVVSFRGCGSLIWRVWYFYLGVMVVIFGGVVVFLGGYGTSI